MGLWSPEICRWKKRLGKRLPVADPYTRKTAPLNLYISFHTDTHRHLPQLLSPVHNGGQWKLKEGFFQRHKRQDPYIVQEKHCDATFNGEDVGHLCVLGDG